MAGKKGVKQEELELSTDAFEMDDDVVTDEDLDDLLKEDEVSLDLEGEEDIADPTEDAIDPALAADFNVNAVKEQAESRLYVPLNSGMYDAKITDLQRVAGSDGEKQPLFRLIFEVVSADNENNSDFVGVKTTKGYFLSAFKRKTTNGTTREPIFYTDMYVVTKGKVANLPALTLQKNKGLLVGKVFRLKAVRNEVDDNKCNFYIQRG